MFKGFLGVVDVLEYSVKVFFVFQDKGKNSLDVIFGNVFGLVVTTSATLNVFILVF